MKNRLWSIPCILGILLTFSSGGDAATDLTKLIVDIEANSLFNPGFLEVTPSGINVKASSHSYFDRVKNLENGLSEYVKEPQYILGYPKKRLFIQKDWMKNTEAIVEVNNYHVERYIKFWIFNFFDGDGHHLIHAASCFSGHGCVSIDRDCKLIQGKPKHNDKNTLAIVSRYAPLFFKENKLLNVEEDKKLVQSFCKYIPPIVVR